MSRAKDLIDLIMTANEIYLVNPDKNIRSAYIQIDDLCELVMKSYLQENINNWSPISHQHNGRDYFKGFRTITGEIRGQFPNDQNLIDLLSRIDGRRDNRNGFFHDQNQAALTVSKVHCLQAFCDLYELMNILFPNAFTLNATPTLRAQIAAIRACKDCEHDAAKKQIYNEILDNWRSRDGGRSIKAKGELPVKFPNLAYEYCVIHYYSTEFCDALVQAGLIVL